MKLTARNVRDLPLPEGKLEHTYPDEDVPGFSLRIRAGGARRLVFQYKIAGATKKITLGTVSALNFAETRKAVERLYARVKLGEDPAAAKTEARIKAAETFGVIARRFLEYQRTHLRPNSYCIVELHLLTHAKSLHGLQLAKIERRTIATTIAAAAENSGTVTSNRLRATLSSLFSWAIAQGIAEINPVIGTLRAPEKARDRVLTPEEIRLVWSNLGEDDHDHYSAVVRLLLLTGQRASEIADLRWDEIIDGKMVLSGERTKNKRTHIVPLSEPALAILEAQPRRAGRDLIFGVGEGGFNGELAY
jgi:integrase